jgi:hypothetical protein
MLTKSGYGVHATSRLGTEIIRMSSNQFVSVQSLTPLIPYLGYSLNSVGAWCDGKTAKRSASKDISSFKNGGITPTPMSRTIAK